MNSPVYLNYDQTALDAQYNNRIAVPEHAELYAGWAVDRQRILMEHDHRLDEIYGDHAAQKLDIILPESAVENEGENSTPYPVNIFIHGGFWMSRSKDDMTFIAEGLVRSGAAVVIIDYALMPGVGMDEIVQQCREAVDWTYRNAASFGADPNRIHVSGNSAGGHLVAMLMSTDWSAFSGVPDDVIKSGCAMSGIYDLEPIRLTYMQPTLNLTEEDVLRNSPIHLMPSTQAPLIVSMGALESDEFKRHAKSLKGVWENQCTVMELPGKNHFTINMALADATCDLAKAVLNNMGLA